MNIICVQRVDNIKCLTVKAANLEPTILQSSYDNYVITARAFFGEDSYEILNCSFRVRDKVKKAILTKSFRELRTPK